MLSSDMATEEAVKAPQRIFTLTAADRCDQCGARAYIKVTMQSLSELLFCAHDGHAHESKLRPLALSWLDESENLLSRD